MIEFGSQSYPTSPPVPTAAPAGYVTPQTPPTPTRSPLNTQALEAQRGKLFEMLLREVVKALVGVFIPGAGPAIEQLREWADHIGDEIVDQIRDHAGIDLASWDALLASLEDGKGIDLALIPKIIRALQGIDLNGGPGAILEAIFGAPLNPARLFENLWPLGLFPDVDAINGSGVWVFDPDVTRSSDSSGSVRVTADGTMKALLSVAAAVAPGQEVEPSVFVNWAGYVGSGAPIQLQIAEYHRSGDTVRRVGVQTIATLGPTTAAGGWAELAGTYTAPQDGSVNLVRGRICVTPGATAGTFWCDDATARNKLLSSWIAGLPEELQALLGRIGAVVDSIVQAFTGASSIGNTLEELLFALQNIRSEVVSGVLGPGSIGESIKAFVDAIVGGLVGESGTGAGLGDVETFAQLISSWASQGRMAFDLLGIRNNTPVDRGMLPSERSNFALSEINDEFVISPGTSLIAFDYIEESMPLGVISWIGWGTSGITEFYVNAYRVTLDRGAAKLGDLIHQSENVVGVLSGTASPGAFISYELPTPAALLVGELIAYELIPVGGSHTVRGKAFNLPTHPSAPIGAQGATRATATPGLPPSVLNKSAISWSQDVPWIGIAVDTGSGSDHHDPFIQPLSGTTTLPIPNWADFVDVVVVGKGGNAADGIAGFYGNPGTPGSFNTVTWARGTHFSGSSTILNFTGSTVSIPGYALTATNGTNGVGVSSPAFGKPVGKGPGTLEYNGMRAIGGSDQTAYGGAGTPGGGAGNGGHWFGIYTQGGNGGRPGAWIQFRKDPLPGETPGSGVGDTTPPNIAGLTVGVGATATTITLTPSGAIDE